MEEFFQANKEMWNERTPYHVQGKFYDVEAFKAGKSSIQPMEKAGLGDVRGKTLLHLQCHFGQDTLSLAREGALTTGVDFSDTAIREALDLAAELGIPARFIECNVYDLPLHLDEQFDIVYTSFGAIPWLPDLEAWAQIVRQFLKPGGLFFMAEFHPTLYLFDFNTHRLAYDYFNTGHPYEDEETGTYGSENAPIQRKSYFWSHSLEETIAPLLRLGLQLEAFREYDFSPFNCFPNMTERAPGEYVYTPFQGVRLPHVFSLKMKG